MTTVARVEREELLGAQARVERTLSRWQRLQRELVAALEVEEVAERALLDRVHQLNLAGVEGKNAAERDAALHVATAAERETVQVARRPPDASGGRLSGLSGPTTRLGTRIARGGSWRRERLGLGERTPGEGSSFVRC